MNNESVGLGKPGIPTILIYIARVKINRVRLPILLHGVSAEQGNLIFLCPRSRLRIWSRKTGSAVVPFRVSLLVSILKLNLMLTYYTRFLPSSAAAASIYLFKPPYAIGPVPSLSSHAIVYR